MTPPPDKRTNSIHVRLSDEADAVLELLKDVSGKDKVLLASELLHRALLGEGHAIRLAAQRYTRVGLRGTEGDR